jgi:hypothetical protein
MTKIHKGLASKPVFYAESDVYATKRLATELRIVPKKYRDEDGNPLLRNLGALKVWHISEKYQISDLNVMKKLGTQELAGNEFLYHLAGDLDSSEPRMRTIKSDEWHTRVANLLVEEMKNPNAINFIKKLALVPLNNGKWVAPFNEEIVFPTLGGITIPIDLELTIVDQNALEIPSRKQLFSLLGVKDCLPQTVFQLIEQRYRAGTVNGPQSINHIKFVFWHHDKLSTRGISLQLAPSWVKGRWFYPNDDTNGWTYCPNSGEKTSMAKLFGEAHPSEWRDHFKYPHSIYYAGLQNMDRRNNRNAVEWFDEFLQVHQTPQLYRRSDRSRRSFEVEFIAENKPECLLGIISTNWAQYHKCDSWDNYFRAVAVPILDSDEALNLENTYLPLPKLRKIVRELKLEYGFGFIKEISDIDDLDLIKWSFLERFGVGIDADVTFYIHLLKQAYNQHRTDGAAAFKIYARLQTFVGPKEIKQIK